MLITINEQSYELHFGMKALELFYQLAGAVNEGSLFHAEQLTAIVWGGLQNGAYRQQKNLPLTFAEVSDWVEEKMLDGDEQLFLVAQAFNESQVVKKMAEKAKEAESEKKKARKSTLKPV